LQKEMAEKDSARRHPIRNTKETMKDLEQGSARAPMLAKMGDVATSARTAEVREESETVKAVV
jgi:hypothetical protein